MKIYNMLQPQEWEGDTEEDSNEFITFFYAFEDYLWTTDDDRFTFFL